MKIAAIIQARMGSQRLPGKVMMKLCNRSVLSHIISRVAKASGIHEIIVATTMLPEDDIIHQETTNLGVISFRGHETDVLSRYYATSIAHHADIIIRITADNPLLDPVLLSNLLIEFLHLNSYENLDYLSNILIETYPKGLALEIFNFTSLEKAYHHAKIGYLREHVTPYIYLNSDQFKIKNYCNIEDLSHFRWTLDTAEDFKLISTIYNDLYPANPNFTTADVLQLFKLKPNLIEINKNVIQKGLLD